MQQRDDREDLAGHRSSAPAPGRGSAWCAPRAGRRAPRAGGPSSTITPSSMKTTWSATSRAKPISWVTTSIVIPSAASSRITSRTSLISSGSSALVTSSKSITCGSIASARAIATRCCWPPESRSGYSFSLSAEADPVEQRLALRARLALGSVEHRPLRQRDVLERALVREEVELLKDHPDPPADVVDVVGRLRLGELAALEEDLAAVGGLEQVDAAQQRALARAAGADDADDLPRRDVEVDPAQDLEACRSSCGRPPGAASTRPRRSRYRPLELGLLAGDQPVDEAGERDRQQEEEDRARGQRGAVEGLRLDVAARPARPRGSRAR